MAKTVFGKKHEYSFHQQIGLKFKDGTNKIHYFEHRLYCTLLTVWNVYQIHLKSFELYWGRMEQVSWTDRVRNAEMLKRVKEEKKSYIQ